MHPRGTVRRTWFKWVSLAVVVGGMGFCGAYVLAEPLAPAPLPIEAVGQSMDRALAPGTAFPIVDRGAVPIEDGLARADVTVPAGECLYAIVGGATPYPFEDVGLFETQTREPLIHARDQQVAGLGWCAAGEPLDLTLWGRARSLRDEDLTERGEGSMLYRFHVGDPEGHWWPFIVGQPAPGEVEALVVERGEWIARQRDERTAPGGTPLVLADLGPDMAIALPLSQSTRWVARALATIATPELAYEPRLQGADGAITGEERPVAVVDESYRRVLAVIDPSDLPVDGSVPCVRLHFTRLAAEERWVGRVPIPSLEEVRGREHRLCPGDPLTAFVTVADDPITWRVRMLRDGGPSAARVPTPPPTEPLVGPTHRRALEACRRGEPRACAEAAGHFAVGRHVARDLERAEELAERACRREAETCGPYGDLLADRGEDEGAVAAWARACATGSDPWACLTLGEAHRLGSGTRFDAAAAMRAYQQACGAELGVACERVETMNLLRLGG